MEILQAAVGSLRRVQHLANEEATVPKRGLGFFVFLGHHPGAPLLFHAVGLRKLHDNGATQQRQASDVNRQETQLCKMKHRVQIRSPSLHIDMRGGRLSQTLQIN